MSAARCARAREIDRATRPEKRLRFICSDERIPAAATQVAKMQEEIRLSFGTFFWDAFLMPDILMVNSGLTK
jgi:hypothetical protein